MSSLCEPESHSLSHPKTQVEDIDKTRIYSNTSSPMSSSSSGDFHQRQPLLQESKNNGGWDEDARIEETHTKVSVKY